MNRGEGGLDRLFDVLSHPHRRRILILLSDAASRGEDELTLEEIATGDDDLDPRTTDLYHNHLPKLHEAGYVTWNRDEGTIERGSQFDEIAPLIGLMHDHQDALPGEWP